MIRDRQALELVGKLDALADEARRQQSSAAAISHPALYAELTERETNYRHAATLAANVLGVPRASDQEPS